MESNFLLKILFETIAFKLAYWNFLLKIFWNFGWKFFLENLSKFFCKISNFLKKKKLSIKEPKTLPPPVKFWP